MPTSVFTIRIDTDTKKKFDAIVQSFGMTSSSAFAVFASQVVREGRIPFIIGKPQEKTMEELLNAISLEANKNGSNKLSLDDINKEITAYREGK